MPKPKRRAIRKRTGHKTHRQRSDKRLDAARRGRLVRAAHVRFLKSGATILDVFGKLDD